MRSLRRIIITSAQNGWTVEGVWKDFEEDYVEMLWVEKTADEATARALSLMDEDDSRPTSSTPSA